MIIGLCGRAGSGKTSIATHLKCTHGARRVALAGPLKRMAQDIYGLTDEQVFGDATIKERVIPHLGVSPRHLLQRLGTEVCRRHLGENVWVNALLATCAENPGALWVVDDVRFVNEARILHAAGAQVWRLHCADSISTDAGTHASEAQVDMIPTALITAELRGSLAAGLEPLFQEVDELMRSLTCNSL